MDQETSEYKSADDIRKGRFMVVDRCVNSHRSFNEENHFSNHTNFNVVSRDSSDIHFNVMLIIT